MHTPHVSIPLPSDSILTSTQYYFTADVSELRSALAFLLTSPTHVLFHATTDGLILQVSVNTCTNFDLYSIGTLENEVRASISTPITFELTPYAADKLAYFLRLAGNFASFSAAKPNYILCASKHYRTVLACSYDAKYEPLEV
jgi:hypothetical protein